MKILNQINHLSVEISSIREVFIGEKYKRYYYCNKYIIYCSERNQNSSLKGNCGRTRLAVAGDALITMKYLLIYTYTSSNDIFEWQLLSLLKNEL